MLIAINIQTLWVCSHPQIITYTPNSIDLIISIQRCQILNPDSVFVCRQINIYQFIEQNRERFVI